MTTFERVRARLLTLSWACSVLALGCTADQELGPVGGDPCAMQPSMQAGSGAAAEGTPQVFIDPDGVQLDAGAPTQYEVVPYVGRPVDCDDPGPTVDASVCSGPDLSDCFNPFWDAGQHQ